MTAHGAFSASCAFGSAGLFWLATGLGWSLFMLGATYGHIREMIVQGNYAPYNFLTIFSDGFIAIWLIVLLYLYYREGGFQNQGSPLSAA